MQNSSPSSALCSEAFCADTSPRVSGAGADVSRWRPGLEKGRGAAGLHQEIFAPPDEASGAGAALALALDHMRSAASDHVEQRAVLWVQDKAALRLGGRPYRPGLPSDLAARLIHVAAQSPEDALFALEEGLRCRDFAFVIGEMAGNPRALDFTASRRLSLAAQKHGAALYLVRIGAARDLSSARMRWAVRSSRSPLPDWNPASPGTPSWHAELFRARIYIPGEWNLRDDGKTLTAERHPAKPDDAPHHGGLAGTSGGGSLASH